MGSPRSVIIANMVMENTEQRALSSHNFELQFWKWYMYVDGVYAVVKVDEYDFLLNHLNSIETSIQSTIQFTIEKESDLEYFQFLIQKFNVTIMVP